VGILVGNDSTGNEDQSSGTRPQTSVAPMVRQLCGDAEAPVLATVPACGGSWLGTLTAMALGAVEEFISVGH